jgi:hypothetical protein
METIATSGSDEYAPERLEGAPSEHGAGYAGDRTRTNFGSTHSN